MSDRARESIYRELAHIFTRSFLSHIFQSGEVEITLKVDWV